jgi:hypothetical protein
MASSTVSIKPSKLRIRAYQVGFGDCLLLTFYYSKQEKESDKQRHVLIDFGSTGLPKGTPSDQMGKVAADIKEQCGSKLHVVVATHRHKDHISGFATKDNGDGPGDVIASLLPDVIIRPWTEVPEAEDPKLVPAKGAKSKKSISSDAGVSEIKSLSALHQESLQSMHEISEAMLTEVQYLTDRNKFAQGLSLESADQIEFLANDNGLPNRSAVENLARMGKAHKGAKCHYVHHGYPLNLSKLLPGVKVHVLGPPTLEQHAEIVKERATDKGEFWMLQAAAQGFWGLQAATGDLVREFTAGKGSLFPDAKVYRKFYPSHDRWFIRQLRAMRGSQMLSLVRILDKAMNNTSVILLFEVGGKKLLFPGDAQIENWEYALKRDDKGDLALLKGVDVYKVGHHGSRNATPKTLWENFERKSNSEGAARRLKTVVSTMPGKHGSKKNHSEVPRRTLVEALSSLSEYHTTETAADRGELYTDIEITFTS